MMDRQVFYLISDRVRANAADALAKADDNAVVTISPPRRTLDQNALLWSILTELSVKQPEGRQHSPETWKLLCMHACGHAVQFEIGLNGQPFPTGFRSSKMTVGEMTNLIEWILAYAAEQGIIINIPEK